MAQSEKKTATMVVAVCVVFYLVFRAVGQPAREAVETAGILFVSAVFFQRLFRIERDCGVWVATFALAVALLVIVEMKGSCLSLAVAVCAMLVVMAFGFRREIGEYFRRNPFR